MGKNLQRHNSMFLQNRNPGCMWGVLQIVKYHRWRLLKKRNSHRTTNHYPMGSGNEGNDLNASESDRCPLIYSTENDFYEADKKNESPAAAKGPVKSDELPKKDQLQRSSSYPALSCRLEPADGNLLRSATMKRSFPLNDVNSNNKDSPKVNNRDSVEVQNSKAMLTDNRNSRRNHWDGIRNKFVENRRLVPRNSDRKQSLVNAREMLDALDLINTNKDLLLKLLQDPSSPFVHHFHNETPLSNRKVFAKSTSFALSSLRGSSPIKLNLDSDAADPNSMPSIAPEYKRRNHIVMNRFKDLKHKLTHMLKQNSKERNRVALDGILHKIPRGKEVSQDLKREIAEHTKKHSAGKDVKEIPRSAKHFSRSTSLKESLDRYSQLYESSFNRELKRTPKLESENSTSPQVSVSKSIRRIFSSPDLSRYAHHIEDSPSVYTSPVRKAIDTATSKEYSDTESRAKIDIQQDLDLKQHTLDEDSTLASTIEPETKPILDSDESRNSVTMDSVSNEKQDVISISEIDNEGEEEPKILENDTVEDSKDQSVKSVKDTTQEPETMDGKIEIPSKPQEYEVGPKQKAESDYVRDVLHISGFSGSELLGTWHSDDQPLDPSMLEEMDSLLFNSECFGVEEGYPCYNLLLFDLINQVLLEIYAKSYTYYPSPLNSRSQIHPMPVGPRVFDEVWSNISWYLNFGSESDQLLDYIASRDFAKNDGWMNLQFDSECAAMEVDDMIFDDLLDDLVFDHFSGGMTLEDEFDEISLS